MNLHEQLGALEAGVDQLIQAVVAPQAQNIPETGNENAPQEASADKSVSAAKTAAEQTQTAEPQAGAAEEAAAPAAAPPLPTLEINRPAQNEITMTIGGQTVALRPEQVGKLIEELSNARASMTPEPPPGIPPGWRFVSTKNPVMAVQKQSNGDRLLVMRHTGHGWVPFTFSPDMVIQLYMMLTNK
ncbi:MAG: Putative tail fiber protein [uncultured Paraburkholderia sp.]|nr:MAG: Putative tail fiber protein [uncultured Paraburkholderia sp.]CAH2915075.1 MAG: Putative tail fiber protein [uncultured Paraburkholderia sp.]